MISSEDDEQLIGKQGEQLRHRRRNVRARGERGKPPQQFEGGIPTDPFQSRVGLYLDNLCVGVNYNTQVLDALYTHMNMERTPTTPPHCPYIPTWKELWTRQGDGVGTSGAQRDDDDFFYFYVFIWFFKLFVCPFMFKTCN